MYDEYLFKIVFEGTVREGEDPNQVKTRLAERFKVNIAAIEKIFREAPTVIQINLTEEKALKYKTEVEKTGAFCRVETMKPVAQPAEPASPPEPPSPPPPYPQAPPAAPAVEEVPAQLETGLQQLDKEGWKASIIGFIIALVVFSFPFLSFIFRYIITLVHELGHAVFAWLFGYPSIPAFDFTYGGGVTLHQDRQMFIVIVVYALLGGLFYLYRKNHLTLLILVFITAFYTLASFTSLHSIIILFMGHGTELIFGGIFLYRGLSGSSVVVEAERPLYAFLGYFVFTCVIEFAHRLRTSPAFRADYEEAKGGGHWMDFSRIAEDYLNVDLVSVASFFFLLCLVAPVLTYLFFRYKNYLFRFFNLIIRLEPNN
jgi:hypothetical protein